MMNEHLHNLLDAELSEEALREILEDPSQLESLQEYRQLQDALRHHGRSEGLSSTERAEVRNALIVATGGSKGSGSSSAGWQSGTIATVLATLLIGIGGGYGLFALLDQDPEPVILERQSVIAVDNLSGSFVPVERVDPFTELAESAERQRIADSTAAAQREAQAPTRRRAPRRSTGDDPSPGPAYN